MFVSGTSGTSLMKMKIFDQRQAGTRLRRCNWVAISLWCRRILGERNLVRVRNIVVAGIFDFMTVEDWGE